MNSDTHDLRKWRCLLLIAAISLTNVFASGDEIPDPELTSKLLMSLKPQERFEFVKGALQNRERAFDHFCVSFEEVRNRTGDDRPRDDGRTTVAVDIIRDGDKQLIAQKDLTATGQLIRESTTSYKDGVRRQLSVRYTERQPLLGSIGKHEEQAIVRTPFFHLLGTRVNNGRRMVDGQLVDASMSISESLQVLADIHRASWTIEVVRENGLLLAKASLSSIPPSTDIVHTWWFDLAKGWMPRRYEEVITIGNAQVHKLYEVGSVRDVGGFSIPGTSSYRFKQHGLEGNRSGVTTFEVKTAAREARLGEDFQVVFPPGTEVIDEITSTAYKVLDGGRVEQIPFLDSSGTVVGK